MNPRLGVLLKIFAALCATLMLACVKGLNGAVPTGEVIFFRSFIALFPLLIWLKVQGRILRRAICLATSFAVSPAPAACILTIWRWCTSRWLMPRH